MAGITHPAAHRKILTLRFIVLYIIAILQFYLFYPTPMTDPVSVHPGLNPPDTPLFSFGMISDIQYCDCNPEGSRFYRESLKKLRNCVNELNSKNLSFVVSLGDLIERDFASYDSVLSILEQINAPVYHVLGNHDFSVADTEKTAVASKLGLSTNYYDFEFPGWKFIALNGCEVSLFAHPQKTKEYRKARLLYNQLKEHEVYNAIDWNGTISTEQYRWLKNSIKTSEEQGERVIIFCHFPVYPKLIHNLWNPKTLLRLFKRHDNVVAYFSGHNHHGSYATLDHVHFLSLKGMVETLKNTAYCTVDVYRDRLEVTGFGMEKSRVLNITDR